MDNSKTITAHILNAFVDNNEGGNPAGVVLDADNLTNTDKLQIAQKIGLTETAFVSRSDTADFKLDFFTPTKQIAHCGHATVATFSYLKQMGMLQNPNSSKETIDGNRQIKIKGDMAFMEQMAPKYHHLGPLEQKVLELFGLKKEDLLPNAPIQVVNTGNSFVLIPVKDTGVLKKISPDPGLMHEVSKEFDAFDLIGFYLFSKASDNPNRDGSSRMFFAPRYGIGEEAGTGMAAGPLACYLFDILGIKKSKLQIEQGRYMREPSTSLIEVELNLQNGRIHGLMAGGKGMLKRQLKIHLGG